jgi:opacity protein-like surface antigen
VNIRENEEEKEKVLSTTARSDWRIAPVGSPFISAGFGTSKREWSAGGAGVGLELHRFDWHDTTDSALTGRIDIV